MVHDASAAAPAKGWYSRGYLPQLDGSGVVQTVVFRLHDSMPSHLRPQPLPRQVVSRFDSILDSGHGACWPREPPVADLTERALMHFDGQRYRLIAWCIMPNHVHAMIETLPGYSRASIEGNPAKAGLVKLPRDWQWSSARYRAVE